MFKALSTNKAIEMGRLDKGVLSPPFTSRNRQMFAVVAGCGIAALFLIGAGFGSELVIYLAFMLSFFVITFFSLDIALALGGTTVSDFWLVSMALAVVACLNAMTYFNGVLEVWAGALYFGIYFILWLRPDKRSVTSEQSA